jgi:hypothetical protein
MGNQSVPETEVDLQPPGPTALPVFRSRSRLGPSLRTVIRDPTDHPRPTSAVPGPQPPSYPLHVGSPGCTPGLHQHSTCANPTRLLASWEASETVAATAQPARTRASRGCADEPGRMRRAARRASVTSRAAPSPSSARLRGRCPQEWARLVGHVYRRA